jgi:hypothetical protein
MVMSWQYAYKSVAESEKSVEIVVDFQRIDDDHKVLESIERLYSFRPEHLPDSSALDYMIAKDLARYADRQEKVLAIQTKCESSTKLPKASKFPMELAEISIIDKELIRLKYALKPLAIDLIKANPEITADDLVSAIGKSVNGKCDVNYLVIMLLNLYLGYAFEYGLIQESSFDAFKKYIVNTSKEELMDL